MVPNKKSDISMSGAGPSALQLFNTNFNQTNVLSFLINHNFTCSAEFKMGLSIYSNELLHCFSSLINIWRQAFIDKCH